MPYALIPDGYSLKQVTKLQKEAVNAKRRHDNVLAFLSNENAPLVVGTAILSLVSGKIITTVLDQVIDETGLTLSEEEKQTIVSRALPFISFPVLVKDEFETGGARTKELFDRISNLI
jgi:hypothetical protein